MHKLSDEEIKRRIHELPNFKRALISIGADEIRITDVNDFTYNDLAWLTVTLGTTAINVNYVEAWMGTDVTPGDPSYLAIVVARGVTTK